MDKRTCDKRSNCITEWGYHPGYQLPPERIAMAKKQAVREIAAFGVSLIRRQTLIGSGVLATAGGKSGILTALHVAELVTGSRKSALGVNIAGYPHHFCIAPECIEPVVIGQPPSRKFGEAGPDLCFLTILDVNVRSAIRARKSFYRLDGRSFEQYESVSLSSMNWWVAGSPDEFTMHEGERSTPSHVLGLSHFHAEATFLSLEDRSHFDFISLEVTAGSHGFPKKYGGVSGGGIWLAPFTMNPEIGPETLGCDHPFLAGIVFYEGDLVGDSVA
jgi:hypothetical protein